MKKIIFFSFTFLATLWMLAGCIHEYPGDSNSGPAIDPTKVKVEMEVALDFTLNPFIAQTRADVAGFRRRFIVDVYREDDVTKPAERKVLIYDNVDTEGGAFRLPVSLNLQPLDYHLVIWTDYIATGTTVDYFYDTSTLSDVFSLTPYRGNTAYRDALYGTTALKLAEYRGEWNTKLKVDVDLQRAVCPIRLIATDYSDFVKKHGEKVAEGATIGVNYGFFIPTGFNALDGLPVRSTQGVSFTASVADASTVDEGLMIVTDYIFVGNVETFAVINLDINDAEGNLLNRIANLKVPYRKGYLTTLKSNFLTSEQSSDIQVDVDFEEDINIDLDN